MRGLGTEDLSLFEVSTWEQAHVQVTIVKWVELDFDDFASV